MIELKLKLLEERSEMADNQIVQNSGVGGALLLIAGVALIILKLQSIITVSWWIVLIPLYPAMLGVVILALILAVVIILGLVAGICWLIGKMIGE